MPIRFGWLAIVLCVFLAACVSEPGKGKLAEERFRQSNTVIAALKQYQKKHGAYPESLSSLVPDEMTVLPRIFKQDSPVDHGAYRRDGSSYELWFRYPEDGMNECRYQPQQGWQCHGYI